MTRAERLEVGGPARLDVRLPSGRLVIAPGEAGSVEVQVTGPRADEFVIEQTGDRVVLQPSEGLGGRWGSFDVTVRAPEGVELDVRAASADVDVEVGLGSLRASLASGDLRAGSVEEDAGLKSASGDLRIEAVGGRLDLSTASGEVWIGTVAGSATINTASGDVRIERVDDSLTLRTASGDVSVGHFAGDSLEAKTISGDLRVGLPAGRTVQVDLASLAGEIRHDFEPGEEAAGPSVRVSARTVSGDIRLTRAG